MLTQINIEIINFNKDSKYINEILICIIIQCFFSHSIFFLISEMATIKACFSLCHVSYYKKKINFDNGHTIKKKKCSKLCTTKTLSEQYDLTILTISHQRHPASYHSPFINFHSHNIWANIAEGSRSLIHSVQDYEQNPTQNLFFF